ncbi:hypothetical protein JCM10213_008237 [Rhodosporidiobolus nylandii]
MSIQAIDRTSVHRLTSGQVVIDLQTAVKELVENALDAGATSIKITFREHGLEAIEVEDNGKGIEKGDWAGIALKHHTSKLSSFSDLASVSTLGFRGEALSSLCGTASLSMTTSTASTAPVGTHLTFLPSGQCVPGGKVARNKGTTVKVERLFENLPVRRKELQKNAKREFGKALELVQAYAIISVGVRFEVRNAMKGRSPQIHLQTTATTSIRSTFSSVYTPKALPSLLELDLTIKVATEKSVLKRLEGNMETETEVRIKGLISKPSSPHGRTAGNRQFYYVNGRPFTPSKVAKAVNEVYRGFNAQQFPTVVADFQLSPDAYDVNVSPDKRTIFLHSEGNLIVALKAALEEFFQPSQATYAMAPIGPAKGSSASAAAQEKRGNDEEEEREGDKGQQQGGEEEEERPRKRRKSSPAPVADAGETDEMEQTGREKEEVKERAPDPSSETGAAGEDISMEVDASFLSAAAAEAVFPSSAASPSSQPFPAADLAPSSDNPFPFEQLPESELVLPLPPSPLRKAHSSSAPATDAAAEARPSSPSPSPAPEAGPSTGAQPLFRASPSPLPAPRSPSPAASTSAARPPSPPPAAQPGRQREPLVPSNLRQPKLPFSSSSASSPSMSSGKKSAKARGKLPAKPPREAMASHLQKFLRGSQGLNGTPAPGGDEADEGDEEEVEGALEEEDELEIEETQRQEDEEEDLEILEPAPPPPDPAAAGAEEGAGKDDDDDIRLEDVELEIEEDRFPDASCACVHGSQPGAADDGDDSDLEISEPVPPSASAAAAAQKEEAELPFGAAPAEVAGTVVAADVALALDFAELEAQWATPLTGVEEETIKGKKRARDEGEEGSGEDGLSGAGIGEREEAAEATLSRVVSKEDFERMEVLGQFNLGFIIARRRVRLPRRHRADEGEKEGEGEGDTQDDLFIVDQHASDEKYNFEKLQAETVIQSQRLLAPRVLSLPSHDEITAMEHLDLLRLNGFDVLVDEDADVGERVKLLAQPVSKDTVFDVGDFEELLDLIASRSGNEVVRPSKARRMFASRACRKSVMIGKALNTKQMTQILRHMGGMEQPWACPHGRPTMRWLFGLGGSPSSSSSSSTLPFSSTRNARSNLVKVLTAYE